MLRSIITPELWSLYRKEYFCAYFDMVYLREVVWPVIELSTVGYDSYHCKNTDLGYTVPFPTQRQGSLYVGSGPTKYNLMNTLATRQCPSVCRPRDHKDWLYC